MTEPLVLEMIRLAQLYAARLHNGHTFTEDEALCYNQILAMVTRLGRAWEISTDLINREEEKKLWREEDDDDASGSTAPTSPPPA